MRPLRRKLRSIVRPFKTRQEYQSAARAITRNAQRAAQRTRTDKPTVRSRTERDLMNHRATAIALTDMGIRNRFLRGRIHEWMKVLGHTDVSITGKPTTRQLNREEQVAYAGLVGTLGLKKTVQLLRIVGKEHERLTPHVMRNQ